MLSVAKMFMCKNVHYCTVHILTTKAINEKIWRLPLYNMEIVYSTFLSDKLRRFLTGKKHKKSREKTPIKYTHKNS
jgi:hypothetical protein